MIEFITLISVHRLAANRDDDDNNTNDYDGGVGGNNGGTRRNTIFSNLPFSVVKKAVVNPMCGHVLCVYKKDDIETTAVVVAVVFFVSFALLLKCNVCTVDFTSIMLKKQREKAQSKKRLCAHDTTKWCHTNDDAREPKKLQRRKSLLFAHPRWWCLSFVHIGWRWLPWKH